MYTEKWRLLRRITIRVTNDYYFMDLLSSMQSSKMGSMNAMLTLGVCLEPEFTLLNTPQKVIDMFMVYREVLAVRCIRKLHVTFVIGNFKNVWF